MTVRRESDTAASEDKFSEILEFCVLVKELLDSFTIIAMRHHEVFLEIDEFIYVGKLICHLLLELFHLGSSVTLAQAKVSTLHNL